MKKVLLNILKYILGFSIGAFLIWWSWHSLTPDDIRDIKTALLRTRLWMLPPVFSILLLSHWVRAIRWKQLIQPLGYEASTTRLLCGILIGYIGNQLMPRAGEIIRCTAVAKVDKIPAEKLIGTIVAERTIDLLCLIGVTIIAFVSQIHYVESYAMEIFSTISNSLRERQSTFIIAGAVLLLIAGVAYWLLNKQSKNTKTGSLIVKILQGIWEGLISIKQVENKWLFVLNSLLIWVLYILSTWIGCLALSETSHLSIFTGMAMLVFGSLGIIISPGGLGAYPIAIQKVLLLYGINANIGLASGWILWLAQFIFTIVFGTAGYFLINAKFNSVRVKEAKS